MKPIDRLLSPWTGILLTLVVLMLWGCGGGVYKSSGKPAPAPDGYEQLCRDYPEFPTCKPR